MNRFFLLTLVFCLSGCDRSSTDYFPLGEKQQREYVIEEQVNNDKHILKSFVTDLEPQTVDGNVYYPQMYANGEKWFFRKTGEGIFVGSEPVQTGNIVLGFPLEPGTTWQSETRIDVLHRRHESFSGGESFISLDQKVILDFKITGIEDRVDVPAGEFLHCLRIDGTGAVKVEARTRGIERILIEQTDWYARGYGLVKRIRSEKSVPEKYQGRLIQELVTIN